MNNWRFNFILCVAIYFLLFLIGMLKHVYSKHVSYKNIMLKSFVFENKHFSFRCRFQINNRFLAVTCNC